MKKKLSLILSIALLLQIFSFFSIEKVDAAAPTKPMTHTIIDTSWRNSPMEGPSYYDYDDGLWYGRLYRINTTWATRRTVTARHSGLLANYRETLDRNPPGFAIRHIEAWGYSNIILLEEEWTSDIVKGKFLGTDDKYYDYQRDVFLRFEHDSFRFTSNYSGTLTARTIPPVIKINTPIGNLKYHNQDVIQVEGFIKDEDIGDKNTIHYIIEGSSHINRNVTLINPTQITATGNDTFFKGTIQLDQTISPGQYKLKVWGKDDKGADSNIITIPIEIYNVLDNIQRDIEKYIPIEKDSDLRFILFNTEDGISQTAINDSLASKIKNESQKRDANLYFVGQDGTTKSYISNSITNNYGIYTQNNTNNIVNYILEENAKLLEKNTTVFLVDEYINYSMLFQDTEKDYLGISIEDKLKDAQDIPDEFKKPKDLQAIYSHSPNVFDNPVPRHSKDNGSWNTINSIEDSYIIHQAEASMRGNWILKLKGSDDTRKEEWDKYSDDKVLNFVIHERPKAIIEHWKEETGTTMYITSENSYDIDFEYSKANNGIIKYVWKYQLEDGSWHDYLETDSVKRITVPKKISGQQVTNYSLTVYDFHGASDTTLSSVTPPLLMEPEAIILAPESIYVGEFGSDVLTVNNDTEPKASVKSYQYTFNFRSVSNYINTTQNTVVNSSSYTFPKNTLRYEGNRDIFTRNVTLKVTSVTDNITQDIAAIEFVPVVIEDIGIKTTSQNIVTLTTDIAHSNPTDHRVTSTVKGIDYPMNYIEGEKWEVKNLNIASADRLYVRVQNKGDSSIVYDKDDIIANRPPTVSISIDPSKLYEGDSGRVRILSEDPDLDNLHLEVRHRVNNGQWKTIWTKSDVPSGQEESFNIDRLVEGYNELIVIATDPHSATGTDSIGFNVLPIKVYGNLRPNPAMAGDKVYFFITTEGYVDSIEIVVPNDIVSKDNRSSMGYSSVKYPLRFNVNSFLEIKEDIFDYIVWISTDLTLDKNNNRLREPYRFIVRAYKEDIMRETELELDIKGDVRELLKPGIKNKYGN